MVPALGIVTVLSEPDYNKLVYVLHDGRRVQMFEQGDGWISVLHPDDRESYVGLFSSSID
jgi:hypothetical protein